MPGGKRSGMDAAERASHFRDLRTANLRADTAEATCRKLGFRPDGTKFMDVGQSSQVVREVESQRQDLVQKDTDLSLTRTALSTAQEELGHVKTAKATLETQSEERIRSGDKLRGELSDRIKVLQRDKSGLEAQVNEEKSRVADKDKDIETARQTHFDKVKALEDAATQTKTEWDQARSTLGDRVRELEQSRDKLASQIKEDKSESEAKVKAFEGGAASQAEKIRKLEQAASGNKLKLEISTSDNAKLMADNATLSTSNAHLTTSVTNSNARITTLETANTAAETALATETSARTTSEAKAKRLGTTVKTLKKEVLRLEGEVKQAGWTLSTANEKITAHASQKEMAIAAKEYERSAKETVMTERTSLATDQVVLLSKGLDAANAREKAEKELIVAQAELKVAVGFKSDLEVDKRVWAGDRLGLEREKDKAVRDRDEVVIAKGVTDQRLASALTDLETTRTTLVTTSNTLHTLQNEHAQLQTTHNALLTSQTDLQTAHRALQDLQAPMQQRLLSITTARDSIQHDLSILQTSFSTLELDHKNKTEAYAELSTRHDGVTSVLSELRDAVRTGSSARTAWDKEREILQAQVTNLTHDKTQAMAACDTLQTELTEKNNALNVLTGAAQQHAQQMADHNTARLNAIEGMDTLAADFAEELQGRADAIKDTFDAQVNDLVNGHTQTVNNMVHTHTQALDAQVQLSTATQTALDTARTDASRLTKDLNDLRVTTDAERVTSQRTLKEANNVAASDQRSLGRQMGELQSQLTSATTAFDLRVKTAVSNAESNLTMTFNERVRTIDKAHASTVETNANTHSDAISKLQTGHLGEIQSVRDEAAKHEREEVSRLERIIHGVEKERDNALARIEVLREELEDAGARRVQEGEDAIVARTEALRVQKLELGQRWDSDRTYLEGKIAQAHRDVQDIAAGKGTVASMEADKVAAVKEAEHKGLEDAGREIAALNLAHDIRVMELIADKSKGIEEADEGRRKAEQASEERRTKDVAAVEAGAERDLGRARDLDKERLRDISGLEDRLRTYTVDPERNGELVIKLRGQIERLETDATLDKDMISSKSREISSLSDQLSGVKGTVREHMDAKEGAFRTSTDLIEAFNAVEQWGQAISTWLTDLRDVSSTLQPAFPSTHPAFLELFAMSMSFSSFVHTYRQLLDTIRNVSSTSSGNSASNSFSYSSILDELRRVHEQVEEVQDGSRRAEVELSKARTSVEADKRAIEEARVSQRRTLKDISDREVDLGQRSILVDIKETTKLRRIQRDLDNELMLRKRSQERLEDTERQLAQDRRALDCARTAGRDAQQEIMELTCQRKALELSRGSSTLQLEAAVNARITAEAVAKERAVLLESRADEIGRLETAASTSATRMAHLESEVRTIGPLTQQLETSEQLVTSLREDVKSLTGRRSELEACVKTQGDDVVGLRSDIDKRDGAIRELESAVRKEQNQLDDMRTAQTESWAKLLPAIQAATSTLTSSVPSTTPAIDDDSGSTSAIALVEGLEPGQAELSLASQALLSIQTVTLARISRLESERTQAIAEVANRDTRQAQLEEEVKAQKDSVKDAHEILAGAQETVSRLEKYEDLVMEARRGEGQLGAAQISFARHCRLVQEYARLEDEIDKLKNSGKDGSSVRRTLDISLDRIQVQTDQPLDFAPWTDVDRSSDDWFARACPKDLSRTPSLTTMCNILAACSALLKMERESPGLNVSPQQVGLLLERTRSFLVPATSYWNVHAGKLMSGQEEIPVALLDKLVRLAHPIVSAQASVLLEYQHLLSTALEEVNSVGTANETLRRKNARLLEAESRLVDEVEGEADVEDYTGGSVGDEAGEAVDPDEDESVEDDGQDDDGAGPAAADDEEEDIDMDDDEQDQRVQQMDEDDVEEIEDD